MADIIKPGLAPNSVLWDISNTSVKICEARRTSPRQLLFFRNLSSAAATITITYGKPAVSKVGFTLNPPGAGAAGDAFADSNSTNYEIWQGEVYAICSAAGGTANLQVVEA